MRDWNDHRVVLHTCEDGEQGWPVCTELDPQEPLVPRLSWEEQGRRGVLRCEGHVPYQPVGNCEREARKRLNNLSHSWRFGLQVGKEYTARRSRARLREELGEARNGAQRFLPLRAEFQAVADELALTSEAAERGAGTDWRILLERAALQEATYTVQRRHPQAAEEVDWWYLRAKEGTPLGVIGTDEEHQEIRETWIRAYRAALLSPAKLVALPRPLLGRGDTPPVLKYHRHDALVWAPETILLSYARKGVVIGTAPDTPKLQEMLPVLWAPDSDGPLSEFQAAVQAAELL